jgi:hypothetical protein
VFKSQANVAAQGSSTLASSSSIETIQLFMGIVAKEKQLYIYLVFGYICN